MLEFTQLSRAWLLLTAQSKDVAVLGDSAANSCGFWHLESKRSSVGLGSKPIKGISCQNHQEQAYEH